MLLRTILRPPLRSFAVHAARSLAVVLLFPLGAAAARLPEVNLRVGGQALRAEVARTAPQREFGLMERRGLPDGRGMLFVFRHSQPVCMWMKNTYIPLSVAFVAADGTIRGMADMRPLSLDAHCSAGPVAYALEVPRGWFAAHAVRAGARVRGLPARN